MAVLESDARQHHPKLGTSYDTAFSRWLPVKDAIPDEAKAVLVFDYIDTDLRYCVIPIAFLQGCGDNSWSYVHLVLGCVVQEAGVLVDVHGVNVGRPSEKPVAGRYYYKNSVDTDPPLTLALGPQLRKPPGCGEPTLDEPQTTVSNSGRSSARQSKFRIALIARDGCCLVTEDPYDMCVAAHIVPQSRYDIYKTVLGNYCDMFDVSAGILLNPNMHSRFDRFEFSIYYKDDAYYIHMFTLGKTKKRREEDRSYHGKRLDVGWFNTRAVGEQGLPDKQLLEWHYRQTVQARLRGFAVGMTVDRQGGSVSRPEGAPEPSPDP